MPRIRIDVSFLGTHYHGWQFQENADTIQKRVEDAFSALHKDKIRVTGCSRTDSGVHARNFVAHADLPEVLPINAYILGVNSMLPYDIRILNARECGTGFDARRDAISKQYIYKILLGTIMPPFENQTAALWRFGFDYEICRKALLLFLGTHDFARFTTADGRQKNTIRTIDDFAVERHENFIIFNISGRSFLHKMVRMILGAVMYASSKKIETAKIKDSLSSNEKNEIEPIAPLLPACGLTLFEVKYQKKTLDPATFTYSYDLC